MNAACHPLRSEDIYEEYFPMIYNYVYYRLLHRENTEDVVSQVFMKAMRHLEHYDPGKASVKTWLFRITDNVLIDFYRRQHPTVSYDQMEADYESALSVQFDEEYDRILSPNRKTVLDALRTLPERERIFIYYKYFLNVSNREIARRMNMNENTVAVIMSRTRGKLKTILQDQIS